MTCYDFVRPLRLSPPQNNNRWPCFPTSRPALVANLPHRLQETWPAQQGSNSDALAMHCKVVFASDWPERSHGSHCCPLCINNFTTIAHRCPDSVTLSHPLDLFPKCAKCLPTTPPVPLSIAHFSLRFFCAFGLNGWRSLALTCIKGSPYNFPNRQFVLEFWARTPNLLSESWARTSEGY
jgi:hypothetical protein